MPQVVIGALVAAGVSATVATIIYYAAVLAITYAVGRGGHHQTVFEGGVEGIARLALCLAGLVLADGPRSRVYGRARNCDGIIFKATHGDKSQFYTMVVALAGHEVDEIEQIYLDDIACTIDAGGWVQTAPYLQAKVIEVTEYAVTSGGVASITLDGPLYGVVVAFPTDGFTGEPPTVDVVGSTASVSGYPDGTEITFTYLYSGSKSYVNVRKFLGTSSQDVGQYLQTKFPTLVNVGGNNDLMAGVACVLVEFEYSQDVFPSGLPGVSAVMRGAKVYDPRTGTTAWSENPALIARDWALHPYAGDCDVSEIRNDMVIAAANACDVMTAFPATSGPTAPMKLYTCGIVCQHDGEPDVPMEEIVESMAGKWGWAGGQLSMVAGVYRNPVATITEDWVSDKSEIVIVKDPALSEAVNVYRPSIANKGKYPSATTDAEKAVVYVFGPIAEVRSETFIAEDGQELAREVALGGVTDVIRAQHVCGVLMREARDGLTLKLPCNLRAFPLELFDIVNVTLPAFGFSAKPFEILDWEFDLQGGVTLTMKETAASIYDPASGLNVLDAAPNTTFTQPWFVPTVTGLAVESGTNHLLLQADGTVMSRALVSWDAVDYASVEEGGVIEVQYRRIDDPEWASVEAPGAATQTYLTGLQDGAFYLFRVRAASTLNVRGVWSPSLDAQVIGKIAPPGNVTGLARAVVASGVRITWNENTEVDYATTEVRVGASWASSSLLFSGKATGYTWLSPSVGTYTVWAKHYDTSANESVAAASISVTVTTADAVNWTSIIGRPKAFRVVSRGNNDTQAPIPAGLYDAETGGLLVGAGPMYTVVRIRRSDAVITYSAVFDTYTSAGNATAMAVALNATGPDSIVVVMSFDDPQTNRLTPALLTAMKRCGASSAVYGSPEFKFRSAFAMVAYGGCGEGAGYEVYNGAVAGDTNAWCDVAFQVQNSQYTIGGSNSTPRSLRDYSYVGDLNATASVSLVPRGNCTVSGSTITKGGATGAWDSDTYSRDSFVRGAAASFVATATNTSIMAGLNRDPTTDQSYTSIDAAWYLKLDGTCEIFESGSPVVGTNHAYAPGNVFAVTYDGVSVRYFHNGTLYRTVNWNHNDPVYFDSSFYESGASLSNVQFGPMSSIKEPMDAAAAAAAAASAAQSSANAANAELANIASDNILSAGEKPAVILDWQSVANERADITAKAVAQGLSTVAYLTANENLDLYLVSLGPYGWNDTNGPSNIVGTTFRSTWSAVYTARQNLLNLIAVTIANGAVGTPQLGNEAATVALTQESASGSSTSIANIISVSWVNTTGATVPIQMEWSAEIWGNIGTCNVSYIDVNNGATAGRVSGAAGTTRAGMTKVLQRNVIAGATITVTLGVIPPTGGTIFWENAVVRLAAIKR